MKEQYYAFEEKWTRSFIIRETRLKRFMCASA